MPTASAVMQQSFSQQSQQGPAGPAAQKDKMDCISKVKVLMAALMDAIPMTLKSAAQILHQNCNNDSNSHISLADCSLTTTAFNNNLEEFFILCDQMEMHLRTAVSCVEQAQAAARYIPLNVNPSQLNPPLTPETLSYTAYLKVSRTQVKEVQKVRELLAGAAQKLTPSE